MYWIHYFSVIVQIYLFFNNCIKYLLQVIFKKEYI